MLRVKATLVSKTRPSGIIPSKAATVERIAFCKEIRLNKNCFKNNKIPIGMMIILIIFKI